MSLGFWPVNSKKLTCAGLWCIWAGRRQSGHYCRLSPVVSSGVLHSTWSWVIVPIRHLRKFWGCPRLPLPGATSFQGPPHPPQVLSTWDMRQMFPLFGPHGPVWAFSPSAGISRVYAWLSCTVVEGVHCTWVPGQGTKKAGPSLCSSC